VIVTRNIFEGPAMESIELVAHAFGWYDELRLATS
jgi:hypothetical protein